MSMIRLLLVDDQHLVRQGIRQLLELNDDFTVVGEAANGQQALDWLASASCDVVLLDLQMPVMDGLQTLQALRQHPAAPAVIVLTTFDDAMQMMQAIQLGAKGFLLKDVELSTLSAAIRSVAAGTLWLQPRVGSSQSFALQKQTSVTALIEPLSEKELAILRLMAGGLSNREIAESLFKSEGTVKNQVSSILNKLHVNDRTRAVLKALECGLI